MNDHKEEVRALIVAYGLDHDERILRHCGEVLQLLHRDRSPAALKVELSTLKLMAESYENLGQFDNAGAVRLSIDVITHELELHQTRANEDLMNRSELGAWAKDVKW